MNFQLFVPILIASIICGSRVSAQYKEEFKSQADILQLPGFSLAVVKDGKVIYRQMEGYADIEKQIPMGEEQLFQIASVTKTFTAALVMQYEQEGKASLEDYVLNYRFINTYFGWPYNIDPNSRLRHFLSHTSEGNTAGSTFVYNGRRFNFIYGLFEKAGAHAPFSEAYDYELQQRIFTPLNMMHTLAGFPEKKDDPAFARIAKPYLYDRSKQAFVEDTFNYRWKKAYPATGILSTIDDLVKYTNAYDNGQLISAASYRKITTPGILNDGTRIPYGIGWFTEEIKGEKIHWHYGHADAYAALFIRVPAKKLTFIFLSNSNAPSEALRLASGHIWQSPFAMTFLKYFAGLKMEEETAIGNALFLRYAEHTYGTHKNEASRMMASLFKKHPGRFDQYDPSLIYLLTDLGEESFAAPLQHLIKAYLKDGHLNPVVLTDLAVYYKKKGDAENALLYYKMLADSKGFEDWTQTLAACKATGRFLFAKGKVEEGRMYFWRAINILKLMNEGDEVINSVIAEMNNLTTGQ
ncbi:serine hydrolase domain-containing protein [Chitinophaga niabensis]|uniref:serine hydrolase domain-containing protein n=1 Tax=Chitinophaga niabensis TaxID=536979 RepID=UPI0031BA1AD4